MLEGNYTTVLLQVLQTVHILEILKQHVLWQFCTEKWVGQGLLLLERGIDSWRDCCQK